MMECSKHLVHANWDFVQSAITPSTFTISPATNITIEKVDTRKVNGIAWFSITAKSSETIAANTTTIIGNVDASTAKKGNSASTFNAYVDTMLDNNTHAWMSLGTTQDIKLASENAILAGTSFAITGSYLY